MEWGSNLCTMLLLALMLKDLVNLIHGAITLDSAKLRVILIVPLVGGMVACFINVIIFNFFLTRIHSRFKLFSCMYFLLRRLFKVNGEPIFIRGGNWILSDGLLRLSKKRYHTDIKFHADMNFNMIRCWGGGLAERPEFYHYCDYYGLLVLHLDSCLYVLLNTLFFFITCFCVYCIMLMKFSSIVSAYTGLCLH